MKMRVAIILVTLLCVAGSPALAQEKQDFSNIKNFMRINDKICTGGQPSLEDLARLKADGVKAVVNLRTASEMNVEEESSKAKELGLRYFHIPFDNANPKAEAADEFLKVMSDPANRPIFIHCTSANRVGAFWMIYRVLKDNWKVEDAEEEAKKVGLRNPQTREFAIEYIRAHEKKSDRK